MRGPGTCHHLAALQRDHPALDPAGKSGSLRAMSRPRETDLYPAIKAALNPVKADDGIFWVSRQEFFKYFETIYLCAKDMAEFLN